MANVKEEMSEEMLDAVTGGAGFYILSPGEQPGTYDAVSIEGSYEAAKALSGVGYSKVQASDTVVRYGGITDLASFQQFMKDSGLKQFNP